MKVPQTKIVLLNGPKRSGKDTSAQFLVSEFHHTVRIGFADYLKRCVHQIHLGPGGWDLDPNHFDAVKEEPQTLLNGQSWRQAYIEFSESYIKPLYGKDWFGKKFIESARKSGADMVVVPDSGFREEAERVAAEFGAENVLLVQLYRPNCTYAGDSRGYIQLDDLGINLGRIQNDDTLAMLRYEITEIVYEWLRD